MQGRIVARESEEAGRGGARPSFALGLNFSHPKEFRRCNEVVAKVVLFGYLSGGFTRLV